MSVVTSRVIARRPVMAEDQAVNQDGTREKHHDIR